jgi:uncharacterized protein
MPSPTANARTVEIYINAYRRFDRETILSCVTDDVEWFIPGAFETRGRAGFAEHIVGQGFGPTPPEIMESRLIEAGDVVVVEGTARAPRADGSSVDLAFCDVFDMRDAKIQRLVSYLVVTPQKV